MLLVRMSSTSLILPDSKNDSESDLLVEPTYFFDVGGGIVALNQHMVCVCAASRGPSCSDCNKSERGTPYQNLAVVLVYCGWLLVKLLS